MIPGQSAVWGGGCQATETVFSADIDYINSKTLIHGAALLVLQRELHRVQYFTSDYKLQTYFLWFVVFTIQDEVTPLYPGFPACLIVTFNVGF